MTATAAEITDSRLDVIAHAREVLERATAEHDARKSPRPLFRVVAAIGALQGALRSLDSATSDEAVDHAVRMAAHWSVRVVAIVEHDISRDAAAYVSSGEDEDGVAA